MPRRLLVADDELTILRILRKELERDGSLQVCGEAHDGAEAIAKANELRPDVIVLDLSMPVVNGIDAARKIAQTLPRVPIILFTLTDLPEVRTQAKIAGIHEVVAKRDGVAYLQAAIASAFDQREQTESTVASSGVAERQVVIDSTRGDLPTPTCADSSPPETS